MTTPRLVQALTWLVLGTLLVSSLAASAVVVGVANTATATPAVVAPVGSITSGALGPKSGNANLVVDGTKVYLAPNAVTTSGAPEYASGGNITVENGGWLYVKNLDIQFQSFTRTQCDCVNDLVSRFYFDVVNGGHVVLTNATITGNPYILEPYLKLNLTVSGESSFSANDGSSLAFPGSVFVSGGSSLFVNRSQITSNPLLPGASGLLFANFTADNSYAPSLLVTDGSTFELLGSYVNNTYKSNLQGSAELNNSFADTQSDVKLAGAGTWSTYQAGQTNFVPAAASLADFSYNQWSSASVNLLYSNPTSQEEWANVTLTLPGGTSTAIEVPLKTGVGEVGGDLPTSYVLADLDAFNLSTFLAAAAKGEVSVNVSGLAAGGVVYLNQTWLEFTPWFQNNLYVSGGSTFIGINSQLDVNWYDLDHPPSPAYDSNKFYLQGGSVGYLVNTTANSYPTSLNINVSAFQPDASSNFYVMQWVASHVTTASGANVVGAYLNATPSTPAATNPNNATGNELSNTTWLATNLPQLYDALDTWWAQSVEGAQTYGESNGAGVATLAVTTNELTGPTLPDGALFGEYNVSTWESATNISTGGLIKVYAPREFASLCGWPYQPTVCSRPSWVPPVTMPLLSADIRIDSFQLDRADASQVSPLAYFENFTITANVTVTDFNGLPIVTSGLPIYVYDAYVDVAPGLTAYNNSHAPVMLTDANFATSTTTTITVSFVLPYESAGGHEACAEVDPQQTNPWPTTVEKTSCIAFESDGVAFWNENGGSPTKGSVTTSMVNAANGEPVTPEQVNTNNSVILVANLDNIGDTAAIPGSVTLAFQLCYTNAQNVYVCQWAGQQISLSGTIEPFGVDQIRSEPVNVTTTGVTTVQVLVNYSISTGRNTPAPISFWAWQSSAAYSVETIDYTTVSYNWVGTETLTGSPAAFANTSGPVAIGQVLDFTFSIRNTGGVGTDAYVWLGLWTNVNGRNEWEVVAGSSFFNGTQDELNPSGTIGASSYLTGSVGWHVSPTVINGTVGNRLFGIFVGWSNGLLNRTAEIQESVSIAPSSIQFTSVSKFASATTDGTGGPWTILVTVVYNATANTKAPAYLYTLSLDFYDPALSGQDNFSATVQGQVGGSQTGTNGSLVTFQFLEPGGSSALVPGTYNLVLVADANGEQKFYTVTGTVTVTGASSCSGFFCGYLWIVLVAAIAAVVVAIVAVLFLGKSGKGRLVECGECGELIPDTATSCPKCGAEFEVEMVRCSRCASTIPAKSNVCPECSALLLGKEGAAGPEEQQRKDYAQTIERFRAEGRKELGEAYSEGSFWDWWKRQPTYLSYSAFKLQQTQGTRAGMSAPQADTPTQEYPGGPAGPQPPLGGGRGGAGGMGGGMDPSGGAMMRPGPPGGAPPPGGMGGAPPPRAGATTVSGAAPAQAGPGMKVCSNCGREINADFFVCPFCSTATQ